MTLTSEIKKDSIVQNLEVLDISSEGKSIAKLDGLVIFIEGAVPGDNVDVFIYRKKSSYAEGRVEKINRASVSRIKPECKHFGTCGGCKWQHLSYEAQLQYKQKHVSDAFDSIGKLQFPPLLSIIANNEKYFYRNKLEFSFSNKRWLYQEEIANKETLNHNALGFHIPGKFDKILDIEECHLQASPSNEIRLAIKKYALENDLTFFDIRTKQGFLRTLMLRTTSTGEWMLVLTVFEWDEKKLMDLLEFLKNNFPQITSLQYVHNPKGNDTLEGLEIKNYSGRNFILEEMEELKFRISAKSFFQTNSKQAYNLYKIVRDFADIKGDEIVYDLYTGTGTIANFIAKQAKKVIGIEFVEDAIRDAKENSSLNNISNTEFFTGDIKDILNEKFVALQGNPDVVITDPPRAGMHPDVVNSILKLNAEKIVYVSCNPATQARDLALMQSQYKIVKTQPVDMFPQTTHVESVVLLQRI